MNLNKLIKQILGQGEHVTCKSKKKGKIKRKADEWDYASCNACGEIVNTHYNAAMIIKQRGISYIENNSQIIKSGTIRCTRTTG